MARHKFAWCLVFLGAATAHYYYFYARPHHALSSGDRSLIREAVTVCVDMPLLAWLPLRFTPVESEDGRVTAIDAAVFYGIELYRIELRTRGGRLSGCSIEFLAG